MPYATPQNVLDAHPGYLVAELTGTETPDTAAIQKALDDAAAEIDTYLGSRYDLPLSTVPASLRRIAVDIAIYRMMGLRGMGDVEDSRKRYEDAVRFLRHVADGSTTLGLPEASSGDSISGIAYRKGSSIMKDVGY